jgi:hypothetical protein
MPRWLLSCLPLLLALPLVQVSTNEPQEPKRPVEEMLRPELFFATLEGLYRDGVQKEVVDVLLAMDPRTGWPVDFVYACPICMPILDALRVYQGRPGFLGDKLERSAFGDGLDEQWVWRLTNPDAAIRHPALQELLEGWISARLDSKRLTVAEREAWQRAMEEGRKLGMMQLGQYQESGVPAYFGMKRCPSCDAANGACELPR